MRARLRTRYARTLLLVLVASLVPAAAHRAAARESEVGAALPRPDPVVVVVRALLEAHAAGDKATIDRLVKRPSPSLIHVVSVLLNPPGRSVSEDERALIELIAERAPASSGAPAYIAHVLASPDAVRKAERARWGLSARFAMTRRRGDLEAARALLEPELFALRDAKWSPQAASLLGAYATLLWRLGRPREAEAELRNLVVRLEAAGRQHEQLFALTELAWVIHTSRPLSAYVEVLETCRALARRLGLWDRVAMFEHQQGMALLHGGELDACEPHLQRALAYGAAAGARSVCHMARLGLVDLARRRGQSALAFIHARQVLAETKPGALHAMLAATKLMELAFERGDLAEAFRHEHALYEHLPTVPDQVVRGMVLQSLAALAGTRGDREAQAAALADAQAAFDRSRRAIRRGFETLGTRLIAQCIDAAERPQAIAALRERLSGLASHPLRAKHLATAARAERVAGDPVRAHALADEALRASRASGETVARAHGPLVKAELLLEDGAWNAARTLFEEARRHLRSGGPAELDARVAIARCLLGAGRPREALDLIDGLRADLTALRKGVSRHSALGLRSREHEVCALGVRAALAWRNADDTSGADALEAAWRFREWGIGALLAEAIRPGPGALSTSVPNALVSAIARAEATQQALVVALADEATDGVRLTRQRLEREHAEVRRLTRLSDEPSTNARPALSLAASQALLGPDEAALAFVADAKRVYGIAFHRTSAAMHDLGSREEIEEIVGGWMSLVATPGGPEAHLAGVAYDRLIAPFRSQLGERASWTVFPDGPLVGVPIGAWLAPGAGGPRRRRLIETQRMGYAYSMAARVALRDRANARSPGRGVVAVGAPTYPQPGATVPDADEPGVMEALQGSRALPQLPASGREARDVSALYPEGERNLLLGRAATRKALLDAVRDADRPLRLVHLACHGIIDGRYPGMSGLVLSEGGVLTAARILAHGMRADLVVLSACDSGGGGRSAGEGILGLTRALQIAGATGVVCSSWQVADESTATMMTRFHRELATERVSAAEALRRAKLALLGAGATAHPFSWAGFQLWGEGRRSGR